MLERPGHNVIARFDQSVQGHAKRVGAAHRKDDAGRIRRIEQAANLLPRLVDNPLGVDRHAVGAASGVGPVLAHRGIDGAIDGFRLGPGRGGII